MSGNAKPVLARKRIRGTFWDHVDKTDGCWEWTGAKTSTGYGNCKFDGATVKAHRASWIMAHGPIPEGMIVCHKCDNPPCVRPDHLFLGTYSDNHRDAISKGRWMSERRRASYALVSQKLTGRTGLKGAANPNTKLTASDVVAIRSRYASGAETQERIAADFGISQVRVSQLVRRFDWRVDQ